MQMNNINEFVLDVVLIKHPTCTDYIVLFIGLPNLIVI